ncbi:MAG: hypothetical protein WC295_03505 [Methanoregula sp.]|jgi:hypothetical protein|nr:hypothetical protein [Methanoregula sp.]
MSSSCTKNEGLAFIIALIGCQLLDYLTAQTLSFVDLVQLHEITEIVCFEDFFGIIVSIALIACIIIYFVASQKTVYTAVLVTTLLSLFALVLNAAGLMRSLLNRHLDPVFLLLDAAIVYTSTILLFSVCYWVLDHESQQARCHKEECVPVLVFPQNQTTFPGYENWRPGFVDYLFLSFNTSTTFGPTDTLILSPRAKWMMMCQVALALIVLVVLAARAVGILR